MLSWGGTLVSRALSRDERRDCMHHCPRQGAFALFAEDSTGLAKLIKATLEGEHGKLK